MCVPNTDFFGKLLVERGLGVLKGFKLVQCDKLNGNFNLFSVAKLLARTEVLLQLPGCLMSRGSSPQFQKFTKLVFVFGGGGGAYEISEESRLGFSVYIFKSIMAWW